MIFPEEERAVRLANQLANPNILEHLVLSEGHSLVQIRAPSAWHNKTLGDIDLRRKYEVNLVAIKRPAQSEGEQEEEGPAEELLDLPMAHTIIRQGDVLVLVGATESLTQLPS